LRTGIKVHSWHNYDLRRRQSRTGRWYRRRTPRVPVPPSDGLRGGL